MTQGLRRPGWSEFLYSMKLCDYFLQVQNETETRLAMSKLAVRTHKTSKVINSLIVITQLAAIQFLIWKYDDYT